MKRNEQKQREPMSGAAETSEREIAEAQDIKDVIRGILSPDAVAVVIALLQTAGNYRNERLENQAAINQVVWFHAALLPLRSCFRLRPSNFSATAVQRSYPNRYLHNYWYRNLMLVNSHLVPSWGEVHNPQFSHSYIHTET